MVSRPSRALERGKTRAGETRRKRSNAIKTVHVISNSVLIASQSVINTTGDRDVLPHHERTTFYNLAWCSSAGCGAGACVPGREIHARERERARHAEGALQLRHVRPGHAEGSDLEEAQRG